MLRSTPPACWLALTLALVGCDGSVGEPAAEVAPPPPPTPEQRLERFLAAFRHWVESDDLRSDAARDGVAADAAAPVATWRSKVDYRFFPAEGGGAPPRAEVSVRTKSSVTMVLPSDDDDEDGEGSDDAGADDGVTVPEGLEALRQTATPGEMERLRSSPVMEQPNEEVSRFEFAFRDGAWELASEVDREAEPFYADAIDYALKRQ